MRIFLAFIKWILVKMFRGLIDQHREFKYSLVHETGVTIFLWLVVSFITSIVMMIVLVGFQYVTGVNVPVQVWFGYIAGCVFYLLYTSIQVMYNAFKAERAQLFETIKNGK